MDDVEVALKAVREGLIDVVVVESDISWQPGARWEELVRNVKPVHIGLWRVVFCNIDRPDPIIYDDA